MRSPSEQLIESGHYARKQIFSRNAIVAWSHRRRFALARELASAGAGGGLLDYGCGDGTFVAMAHDLFQETIGADVDTEQLRDCAARLSAIPGVRFASTETLRHPDTPRASMRSSAWKFWSTARRTFSPTYSRT